MEQALDGLKQVMNITFNYEKIYGTDKMIKPDTGGEEGLWRGFSDIYDKINELEKWLVGILDGNFAKKLDFDTNWSRKMKIREKQKEKESLIRKESIKEGQKIATEKYNKVKLLKNDTKKVIKSYKEGLKKGKEIEHLTNKEILNKAKIIELNKKLGFMSD